MRDMKNNEMTELKNKVCSRCGEEKLITEFGRHSKHKDGYEAMCKTCRSAHRYENGSYFVERLRKHAIRTCRPTMYTEKVVDMMRAATNCCYCDVKLTHIRGAATQATFDHVYLNKNIDNNLVVCCRACNTSKFQDPVYTFYQRSESFTDELWSIFLKDFLGRLYGREVTNADIPYLTAELKAESEEIREWHENRVKQLDQAN